MGYANIYKNYLLQNVIPFWEKNSIDYENGGFFTCLNTNGEVYDTDKFMWLQFRQVWCFSMLYNQVEQKKEWLDFAIQGAEFLKKYGKRYKVIRNLPVLEPWIYVEKVQKFILYQGAVNEGRGLEYLIPAMKAVPFNLVICGDGNFMYEVKKLIRKYDLVSKVELKGMLLPEDVKLITKQASLGIALSDREGINQYHALPNKFLDYIHAGLPQLAMNFPEYKRINSEFKVAHLIDELSIEEIAFQINKLMNDDHSLLEMHQNCLKARKIYCWQNEEVELIKFYKYHFPRG